MENIDYQIERAYKSWQQSINVFNNAVTKEDIDYAIYNMETKKKQYLRLLHTKRVQALPDTPPQRDFE